MGLLHVLEVQPTIINMMFSLLCEDHVKLFQQMLVHPRILLEIDQIFLLCIHFCFSQAKKKMKSPCPNNCPTSSNYSSTKNCYCSLRRRHFAKKSSRDTQQQFTLSECSQNNTASNLLCFQVIKKTRH